MSAASNAAPLHFAGYAALFGKPDAARDVILPGAFRRTLAERRSKLPVFWQHRPEMRIGWVETIGEDERGLRVVARLDRSESRAAKMLTAGSLTGLSFGYRARQFRSEARHRILADVELFEISLVSHPLQHGARVHLVAPPRSDRETAAVLPAHS